MRDARNCHHSLVNYWIHPQIQGIRPIASDCCEVPLKIMTLVISAAIKLINQAYFDVENLPRPDPTRLVQIDCLQS